MSNVFLIEMISAAGSIPESIWSTREGAEAEQKRLTDKCTNEWQDWYIYEIALDTIDGYDNPIRTDK